MTDLNPRATLEQLFAATINQQTLEEAVDLMCSVSLQNADYHDECLNAINFGINFAKEGDDDIINIICRSGYQANNIHSALQLLTDLRAIYLGRFNEMRLRTR